MNCQLSKSTNSITGSISTNQIHGKKIGIVGTANYISNFAMNLKQNGQNVTIQFADMLKDDHANFLESGINIISSVDRLIKSCDVIVGAFNESHEVANFFSHHISQRFYRRSFVDMTTHDDEDIAQRLPTLMTSSEGDKARLSGVLVNGIVNSMIFQVIKSFGMNGLPVGEYLDVIEAFGVDKDLVMSYLSKQDNLKLVENMKHVVKNFDILEKFGGTKFFGESKKRFEDAIKFISNDIKKKTSSQKQAAQ